MTIASLAKWVLGLLDALALFSIYATSEIRIEAGLLVLVIFLTRTLGVRLRSLGALVLPALGILALGVFLALKFRIPPILVAAHIGVILHAMLWLGKDDVRDRVLRLSMGFINLTLASALTTDLYLFGSIFAFAILGSIYISLGFLESTFKTRLPEQLSSRLPAGYLKNMLSISFAVFMISLLLFPLIPRASWKKWEGSNSFQVGYNDTVDLSSASQAASQSGRVALRIISQTREISDDPREAIPWGLLRGKTLDLFDGKRWLARSGPRLKERKEQRIEPVQFPFAGAQFEVIREPQVNRVVFKPYGALIGEIGEESGRSHYFFKSASSGREIEYEESPDEKDLDVPPSVRDPRLISLAQKIMGLGGSNREKARLLSAYYKVGFSGTLDGNPVSGNVSTVLEDFLLKSKKGNCELFAGSAAILLRIQGVPARLIAGYRVNRHADAGLLTVLDNDAHAWLEYWNDTQGWLPMDPTPQVLRMPSWTDSFEQIYWLAQGKWYSWMIDFQKGSVAESPPDSSAGEVRMPWSWGDWATRWKTLSLALSARIVTALFALGVILILGLFAKLSLGSLTLGELKLLLGWRVPWSRRRLYLEYLRYERRARKLKPMPERALAASTQWREIYLRLRFGMPPGPIAFDVAIRRLRELAGEMGR